MNGQRAVIRWPLKGSRRRERRAIRAKSRNVFRTQESGRQVCSVLAGARGCRTIWPFVTEARLADWTTVWNGGYVCRYWCSLLRVTCKYNWCKYGATRSGLGRIFSALFRDLCRLQGACMPEAYLLWSMYVCRYRHVGLSGFRELMCRRVKQQAASCIEVASPVGSEDLLWRKPAEQVPRYLPIRT